jgi:hypothetical protein
MPGAEIFIVAQAMEVCLPLQKVFQPELGPLDIFKFNENIVFKFSVFINDLLLQGVSKSL